MRELVTLAASSMGVLLAIITPFCNTNTLLHTSVTSSILWDVNRIETPNSFCCSTINFLTSRAISGSSDAVGSSSNTIAG